MAGCRGVQIECDAVGAVVTTRNHNVVDAHVRVAKNEAPLADPTTVAVVMWLAAKKIGPARDDAHEEASKKGSAKDELGNALDRALNYARSAPAFSVATAKLTRHLKNAVTWLG